MEDDKGVRVERWVVSISAPECQFCASVTGYAAAAASVQIGRIFCTDARRLRLRSVTGFHVSMRPRLAEFAAVGRTTPGMAKSRARPATLDPVHGRSGRSVSEGGPLLERLDRVRSGIEKRRGVAWA